MKKILLPTDFSENSWNAIAYASQLFSDESCVFYLLHTYSKIIYESVHLSDEPSERTIENTIKFNAITNLERVKKTIDGVYPNTKHQYEMVVALGNLTDTLKDVVKKEKIDLIVMGTKGSTGAKEIFVGSNTTKIINTIKSCPVIAVPSTFRYTGKPSEITFATDFNHFYSKEELRPLLELAYCFDASVRIVHITEEGKELTDVQKFNLSMLKKYLGDIKHYQHTITKNVSVSTSLKLFTEELDIYLLAMLHYKHSFIEKLTREPVIKTVTFQTEIPFLVIPELGMSSSFSTTVKKDSIFVETEK